MTDHDDIELERIAAEARQLPPLTPSRDLWPGIAARIGQAPPRAARPTRLPGWNNGLRLLVAASLLVAVTSGITWTIATRAPSATAGAPGLAATVDDETAAALHLAAFDASVTTMDEEIALLQGLVAERRDVLDPRTLAVLQANLRVIDRAIAESRKALAADPSSQFLAAQFARAYTSKITLLREAATLPTGI
ncbi:MAG: hypothetical protein WD771_05945 [Gemmatimonadaceae bacterium]